jgi:hypothetical protein
MSEEFTRKETAVRDRYRSGECGQGRLKFLIVLTIIFSVGYVLYQYVPVAYQAFVFKDFMQHEVDVAAASGYDTTWLKTQLAKSAPEYGVPGDAVILPSNRDGRLLLNVKYTRQIPLPGYVYVYDFDHTVKSTPLFAIR